MAAVQAQVLGLLASDTSKTGFNSVCIVGIILETFLTLLFVRQSIRLRSIDLHVESFLQSLSEGSEESLDLVIEQVKDELNSSSLRRVSYQYAVVDEEGK